MWNLGFNLLAVIVLFMVLVVEVAYVVLLARYIVVFIVLVVVFANVVL